MTPTISAPATGTPSTSSPSWLPAGETMPVSHRPKKKRFVKRPISRSSPSATTAPSTPMPMAATDIETSRQPAVKSPSSSALCSPRSTIRTGRGRCRARGSDSWIMWVVSPFGYELASMYWSQCNLPHEALPAARRAGTPVRVTRTRAGPAAFLGGCSASWRSGTEPSATRRPRSRVLEGGIEDGGGRVLGLTHSRWSPSSNERIQHEHPGTRHASTRSCERRLPRPHPRHLRDCTCLGVDRISPGQGPIEAFWLYTAPTAADPAERDRVVSAVAGIDATTYGTSNVARRRTARAFSAGEQQYLRQIPDALLDQYLACATYSGPKNHFRALPAARDTRRSTSQHGEVVLRRSAYQLACGDVAHAGVGDAAFATLGF